MSDDKPQKWRSQYPPPDQQRPAGSARGKKIFVLAALMLALVGAALAWVFYVRPMSTPYFVSLPLREYAAHEYPVNALVVQDSDLLLQHFPKDKRQKAYESQLRDRLRFELQKLKSRGDGPIVVHLCALARPPAAASVRAGDAKEDDVFLLPADADPAAPKSWLSLREVLQALRDCPASDKLLLLDFMRPIADARLGILDNDIATRVHDLLDKEKLPNTLVLCACGRGQLAHVSENLKHSIFAYYLDQGLRGGADGLGPQGRENRRITVTELAAYVQEHVERWSRFNRGVSQKPVLLGQGDDFPLVHMDEDEAEPAPEWRALTLPAWIRAGWELRDRSWEDGSYRLQPRLFRQLENVLLRVEQRWLGGIEEDRLKTDLKSDLDFFEVERKKALDLPPCGPFSLAMRPDKKIDPDVERAFADMLNRAAELTAKPENLDKEKLPFKEKFKKAPLVPLAWTVFDVAQRQISPSAAQVQVLHEMAKAMDPPAAVELFWLVRLVELGQRVKDNEWKWPGPQVQQCLRTLHQAELAVASLAEDPSFLPLLEQLFKDAEASRHLGEKALVTGRPSGWEQAGKLLGQAERGYLDIQVRLENLRRARRDFDQATVLLPGLADYLVNQPDVDQQEETIWQGAIRAGKKLGDILQAKEPDPSLGMEELDHHRLLGQNLRALRRLLAERLQRFLERVAQPGGREIGARDYHDFLALRASPHLTAKERDSLWKGGQLLARRLHDDAQNQTAALPPLLPDHEARRKTRRAAVAIDLLRLGNFKGVDGLQTQLDKASSPKDWSELADRLRETWTGKLSDDLRTLQNRLAHADRLSRIVPLVRGRIDPSHWTHSPATLLAHDHAHAFRQWLGLRCRAESLQFPTGSPAAKFFTEAAESCQR